MRRIFVTCPPEGTRVQNNQKPTYNEIKTNVETFGSRFNDLNDVHHQCSSPIRRLAHQ